MAKVQTIKGDWPADRVERRALTSLLPYAKNSRTHTDEQVKQIANSIREWGWTTPVLIDEGGTIIAGHARVLAAKKLKIAEVPVMVARGWTEAQRRAYVLADNQLAMNSGWDNALLVQELADLQSADFDLTLLGFAPSALSSLSGGFGPGGNGDPEAVPEPPSEPVSRPGDLYLLGDHRLLCGDSTVAFDVARVLDGASPHLMVTDPPYGVEYDPEWREGADLGIGKRSKGKVANDDRIDWREAWALFPGDVAYVWHASFFVSSVQASLEAAGFVVRSHIIWAKQHFAMSRGDYHWQHEPCWYAVRKGKAGRWSGDRKQTTLWEISNNNSFGNANHEKTWGHGTQKPIECMRRPIINSSKPGDAVYEPFAGSGTTLIACQMEARRCYAIELSPIYVDVIVRRWEEFTGKKAVRVEAESTGVAA